MSAHVRPSWDEYFLGIAEAVSARGECLRSRVGAVLVLDNRILATGYNGTAPGAPSCLDGICPRASAPRGESLPYEGPGACVATHAEENVWRDAARRAIFPQEGWGAVLYVNREPCEKCDDLLRRTTDWRVVWKNFSLGTQGEINYGE